MHQLFTDQSRTEFIERLRTAAMAMHHHNCTRQEIFEFCLAVAPGIYREIYDRQASASGNMFQPEQVVAEVIGEVVSNFPS